MIRSFFRLLPLSSLFFEPHSLCLLFFFSPSSFPLHLLSRLWLLFPFDLQSVFSWVSDFGPTARWIGWFGRFCSAFSRHGFCWVSRSLPNVMCTLNFHNSLVHGVHRGSLRRGFQWQFGGCRRWLFDGWWPCCLFEWVAVVAVNEDSQ